MASSARLKMVVVMALFALPVVGSTLVYYFFPPERTASYGELLLPPAPVTGVAFERRGGGEFRFESLRGKWLLVASDTGACPDACVKKLTLQRQVRLMLGRGAGRVERVFVADDSRPLPAEAVAPFEGAVFIAPLAGMPLPLSAVNDRAHVYVVDPLGNVMMRFPASAEPKRMLKDLERLLKASQIG